MTSDALSTAETEYRAAVALANAKLWTRNGMVRDAIRDGWSHARIAEAAGLTRSRVGQIALADKNRIGDAS